MLTLPKFFPFPAVTYYISLMVRLTVALTCADSLALQVLNNAKLPTAAASDGFLIDFTAPFVSTLRVRNGPWTGRR